GHNLQGGRAAGAVTPACPPLPFRKASHERPAPTFGPGPPRPAARPVREALLRRGRGRQRRPRRPGHQRLRRGGPRPARCPRASGRPPPRPPCSSASKPRRRLPPPPPHPTPGKALQNKGPEDRTVNTVNGRVTLTRRRYAAPDVGSCHPLDRWLDQAEDTVSLGLREMACRINQASRSFDKAAENLARAAQVRLSGELLRQGAAPQGGAIQAAARAGRLPVGWDAGDCPALDQGGQETDRTRVYLGSDGVMVPTVTDAEKRARRHKVKAKRRRRGKKCKPLP